MGHGQLYGPAWPRLSGRERKKITRPWGRRQYRGQAGVGLSYVRYDIDPISRNWRPKDRFVPAPGRMRARPGWPGRCRRRTADQGQRALRAGPDVSLRNTLGYVMSKPQRKPQRKAGR